MWIRLLRLVARRPLVALAVAGVTLISVLSLLTALLAARATPAHEVDGSANPRQLIRRIWFDRYPEKSRDEVDLFIFFGGGFGIYEHGVALARDDGVLRVRAARRLGGPHVLPGQEAP